MEQVTKDLKTITDMRNILAEEIMALRKGETTAANVNAVVNASGKLLSSVKLEMEYNRLLGTVPEIAFVNTGKRRITGPPESEKKGEKK